VPISNFSFDLSLAGQLTFGFYYRGRGSGSSDTPTLTGLRNDRTSGITGCIWFYPTILNWRMKPSLFQYTLDYAVDGFRVGLIGGSSPQLEIVVGDSDPSLKVDFPVKLRKWCQLCVTWYRGTTSDGFLNSLESARCLDQNEPINKISI